MQRGGKNAIGHQQIDRIGGICHETGETPGESERGAKLPDVELIDTQAPEGALPVALLVEPFRQLERDRPRGAGLPGATDAVHQRPAERRGKLHARPRGRRLVAFENGERPIYPLAPNAEQR